MVDDDRVVGDDEVRSVDSVVDVADDGCVDGWSVDGWSVEDCVVGAGLVVVGKMTPAVASFASSVTTRPVLKA